MAADKGARCPRVYGGLFLPRGPNADPGAVTRHYSEVQGPLLQLSETINTNK